MPIELSPGMTMNALARTAPGARRALFRAYHIGGCASCGFRAEETLEEVCARNDALDVQEAIRTITEAHAQDEVMLLHPGEAARLKESDADSTRFLDIRSREEFDAVQIPGSTHFTQEMMQEIVGTWPRETGAIIIVDHTGDRALDAAAYFGGHGFSNIRALRGGIDAWCAQVDPSMPRYELEMA